MKSLAPASSVALVILASATVSYADNFPYDKPTFRFEPFHKLSATAQSVAESKLNYVEVTWNNHGLADIEKKRWSQMTSNEREGAISLGYNEDIWDCFINHYEQFSWDELAEEGVQKEFVNLGWTQAMWERTSDEVAYTESRWWGQLTDNEKKAANNLCYFEDNWDKKDMMPNPSFFPHPMPAFRYVPWDELDFVTKNVATGLMNYTEDLWNNLGSHRPEKNTFLNLQPIERDGALELGFYTHTWDCFMNHYMSYYWSSFHEDLRVAVETLGWTEEMWSDKSDEEPASEETMWEDLTAEEKAAATRLCYFQETWDEEDIPDFYDYEKGETEALVNDGPLPKDIDLGIFEETGYNGKEPGSVGAEAYTAADTKSSSPHRSLVSSSMLALVMSLGVYLVV